MTWDNCSSHAKLTSKQIFKTKYKVKTIKLLKKKTYINLCDLELGNEFWDITKIWATNK